MYTHLPYPSANVYQFYIYFISNVYPITIAQRQPSASPAQAQRSPALLSATLMTQILDTTIFLQQKSINNHRAQLNIEKLSEKLLLRLEFSTSKCCIQLTC